jgi:hypothetical protein
MIALYVDLDRDDSVAADETAVVAVVVAVDDNDIDDLAANEHVD